MVITRTTKTLPLYANKSRGGEITVIRKTAETH